METNGLVKHFECTCTGEIVRVEHDNEDNLVYVAIYTYGYYDETWSLWKKLKYCWDLLKGRGIWGDQVILSKPEAERLGNFLIRK